MYNEKLIQVVRSYNFRYPPTKISTDLEVSKGTISSYLNGKVKASDRFLEKFANFYNANIEDISEITENSFNIIKASSDELLKENSYLSKKLIINLETQLVDLQDEVKFLRKLLENKSLE